MPKNRGRPKSRRKGFVAIPFEGQINPGALAADTVVVTPIITFAEDIYCVSMDVLCALRNVVPGQGPVQFGVAHSDLSLGEIEEFLQLNLADPNDLIANEKRFRPVRRVGQFSTIAAAESWNDGNVGRIRLKMPIGDTFSLSIWAYNRGTATMTTGSSIRMDGTLYGRWKR